MVPETLKAAKVVPVPVLRFDNPSLAGTSLRLDHEVATLGRRADNAYVVPDAGVSRVHAELRRKGSTVLISDVGSASGTKVNGERITGPTVLRHADRVSFGEATATFEDPAAVTEADDPTIVFELPEVQTGPRLSPRQQQVVELMAEGMTNAQAGAQLGITERTVKAYAQELYDKLGVRNRAGAVAEAWHCGLLGDGRGLAQPSRRGRDGAPVRSQR